MNFRFVSRGVPKRRLRGDETPKNRLYHLSHLELTIYCLEPTIYRLMHQECQKKTTEMDMISSDMPLAHIGNDLKSSHRMLWFSQRCLRMPQWHLRMPQWQFFIVHLHLLPIHKVLGVLLFQICLKNLRIRRNKRGLIVQIVSS